MIPGLDLDMDLATKIAKLITDGPDDKQPERAITALCSVAYCIGALSPMPTDVGLETVQIAVKLSFNNGVKLRASVIGAAPTNPLEALAKEWEQRKPSP